MSIEIKISKNRIPYKEAMLYLNKRVEEVKNGANRELLWILEHPTTYTAGVSFNKKESYISAIGMVQGNARFISKNINQARPGDLIFFDMQDSQHLMVWMGNFIAYHTGTVTKKDNGLRKINFYELLKWKDSRWRPELRNPNFIGIFRFSFLSF